MENEKQKYVTIGDSEYMIMVLPPTRAIKLLTKLAKIIGEPMSTLTAGKQGEDGQVSGVDMLPKAVSLLMQNLDEQASINLIKEMMTCVTVDNKSVNFEKQFHGKLGELMKVCKEVLEVNYADFLQEISELMV